MVDGGDLKPHPGGACQVGRRLAALRTQHRGQYAYAMLQQSLGVIGQAQLVQPGAIAGHGRSDLVFAAGLQQRPRLRGFVQSRDEHIGPGRRLRTDPAAQGGRIGVGRHHEMVMGVQTLYRRAQDVRLAQTTVHDDQAAAVFLQQQVQCGGIGSAERRYADARGPQLQLSPGAGSVVVPTHQHHTLHTQPLGSLVGQAGGHGRLATAAGAAEHVHAVGPSQSGCPSAAVRTRPGQVFRHLFLDGCQRLLVIEIIG